MSIADLKAHPAAYVTVGALAKYLHVSRRQILKNIHEGTLFAVRFGPRLYRIPVSDAADFEHRSERGTPSNRES